MPSAAFEEIAEVEEPQSGVASFGDIASIEPPKISAKVNTAKFDDIAVIHPPPIQATGFTQPESVRVTSPETTSLTPSEETRFQSWARSNKITDVDKPNSFYDYRGYWKEHGDQPVKFGVDHFPDTYKQHGHPTFSVESKYSKGPSDGGHWQGDQFIPIAGDPRVLQPGVARGRIAVQAPFNLPAQGAQQVVAGVKRLGAADLPAATVPSRPGASEVQFGPLSSEAIGGANDVIEGVFKLATPLIAGALVANPIGTGSALFRAWLTSKVGEKGAELVGASPEGARFAGNVGALLSGTIDAKGFAEKVARDARAVAEQVRAFDVANPDLAPGAPPAEAKPVGRGATEAVREARTRLEPAARDASAPVEPGQELMLRPPERPAVEVPDWFEQNGIRTIEPESALSAAEPVSQAEPIPQDLSTPAPEGQNVPSVSPPSSVSAVAPSAENAPAPAGEIAPRREGERLAAPPSGLQPPAGDQGRAAERRPARRATERAVSPAADADVLNDLIGRAVTGGYTGPTAGLRAELTDRLQLIRDLDKEYESSGRNPETLLKAIAAAGGIGDDPTYPAEVKWLRQLRDQKASQSRKNLKAPPVTSDTVRGIRGVIRPKEGTTLGRILEALRQDPKFEYLETVNDLIDEVRAAATAKPDMEAARALRKGLGERWWENIQPVEAQPEDVLETGETQPRLPEAGAVREQNIATPEFEVPFSLESEVDRTARERPEDLFGGVQPGDEEGGITLQSTILPGAKEAGEAIVAGGRKLAEEAKRQRSDIVNLFAPDILSTAATKGAGIMRANLAARAQRTQRAQRALSRYEKLMDGWSQDQSRVFWDVMEGQADPRVLPADAQEIARTYRQILDTKREELLKRNLLKSYLEHYWGHEWVKAGSTVENAIRRLLGKRPLHGPESYRRQRTIPTMREGLALGLEPVSWNPTTQLLRKLLEMDKSIAGRDIYAELKEEGLRKFVRIGRPLPEGWRYYPDYAAGVVYGPATTTNEAGEETRTAPFGRLVAGRYAGPAEVVRLIENHLSPGLRGRSRAFDLYRTAGNFLNQLQLGFSAFHGMMTAMESVVSKQSLAFELLARGEFAEAVKAQAEVPVAPLLHVVRGHKLLKEFYKEDANAQALDGVMSEIIQAGGGFGWDLFEHSGAPGAFMAALRATSAAAKRGDYGTATGKLALAALKTVPAAVEMSAKPIMEFWVPRLKIAAFQEMAAMELRTLGPEPDLQEVRRVLGGVWDSIDNRFGQLRYDNLFWHNALKDLGMGSVRALGWNVGTVREMFGAPVSQIRQLTGGGGMKPPMRKVNVGRDAEGEPIYETEAEQRLHRKMAWFAAMVISYGLAGAVYQKLRTHQSPKELRDYFFPRTGEADQQGRPRRVSIAGYFKDLYAVAHAFPRSAWETAGHKLNPMLTLIADVLSNEDYFGVEVRNLDDPLVQQLGDVMRYVIEEFKPISVRSAQQRGSQESQVESYFGITPAPATVTRTDLEQYLRDIAPPTHMTQEQAKRAQARRDVRALARGGKMAEAVREAQKLGLSVESTKRVLREARTGGLQGQFERTTWRQALKGITIATPEERALLRTSLARKVGPALSQARSAEDRKELLQQYQEAMRLPVATTKD
jgi:hypothetical protein